MSLRSQTTTCVASTYEKIEVLRGSAGMLHVAPEGFSLGGIINLVKKTPGKDI